MNNTKKTIEGLKAKASFFKSTNVKMPSIKDIHNLLVELNIKHYYDQDSVNIVSSKSGNRTYVNERHNGKAGKKITINNTSIELDSSDSYYSYNTSSYARKILDLININY